MTSSSLVTFDTAGFEPCGRGQWFVPRHPYVVVLTAHDALPPSAAWLDELDVMRGELARRYAAKGQLIEADSVSVGAVRALYTLVKEPIPGREHGFRFRASFLLAKRARTVVLRGQFDEWDITGMRESLVLLRRGVSLDDDPRHPYAPELRFHPSDDAAWDFLLPEHPLTTARTWARTVRESAVVDPDFAAEPDYA
ncbi:hypothetical protein V2W30_03085 [Streptomyces sp. Q6]|uniref:Uncharacterized protein n=1 Tax=Streptomyces citrinus TaxID=3118173 RepID=A0ACD5A5H0_9ACTN